MTLTCPTRVDERYIPRAPRHDVDLAAYIEGPTVLPFTSRVKNISTSGMLLADSDRLQVGDFVYVTLPGKEAMLCVVARLRKNGGAGIKFENSTLDRGFLGVGAKAGFRE